MSIAIKTAPTRARSVAKLASRTATKIAPRRPMSKKRFEQLLAEQNRLNDKASIGDVFRSPFGGLVIKLEPITDEDVYAIY
jgi:hypothetical protein